MMVSDHPKVLLLKVERPEDENQLASPMGIMYVADAVRKAGFDVEIIHETWTEQSRRRLIDKLQTEQNEILLVGFSTITGPSLGPTIAAAKVVKNAFPAIRVVWGGVHASLLPEETLRNEFVDVVVIGEGEETLVQLAVSIRSGRPLGSVEGIGFKENGIHITKARDFIDNLDEYEPAWDLVNVERYYRRLGGTAKRALDVVASRGCPYGCTFCYNITFNRRKWRPHSARYVISQVRTLKQRYNADSVYFQDDNFFTDKARAYEIVGEIGIPWYAEIRADKLREEDVDRMARLGCRNLFIGAIVGSSHPFRDDVRTCLS
jgi:anaerobic magnesium-protoporphyrin IX monomethyl ester cyclase